MSKKHLKEICFLIAFIIFIKQGQAYLPAAENHTYFNKQQYADILFVIDSSNSMNGNDVSKTAIQMIEAFIDLSDTEHIRIGFVSHNDKLLDMSEPVSLKDADTREALKESIRSVRRSGSTDTGLALKTAAGFLEEGILGGRQGRIVVLSDGEPDLASSKEGRTIEECYQDMEETASYCAENGIPIDTIAFGLNYTGSTEHLEQLSNQTDGRMYLSDSPELFPVLFEDIVSQYSFSSFIPVAAGISDGTQQTMELDIQNTFADAVNFVAVSPAEIQDASIVCSGAEISFSKNAFYFTGRITNAGNETASLQIKGTKGQEIKVYLILYQNKEFRVELPETIHKNEPFTFRYAFYDTDGPVTSQAFYEQLSVKAASGGEGTNIYELLSIKTAGGGMEWFGLVNEGIEKAYYQDGYMHVEIPALTDSGTYAFQLQVDTKHYSFETELFQFDIQNAAPKGGFIEDFSYVRLDDQESYNLNEYFSDADQDPLSFAVIGLSGTAADILSLENGLLNIHPKRSGTVEFQIRAVDPEGEYIETSAVSIYVEPLWRHYLGLIIGGAALLLMLIFYFLWIAARKRRVRHITYERAAEQIQEIEMNSAFSGKLNVYFTKMRDDMEVEPMTFALYQIKEKMITLAQLLNILDAPEKELDSENIQLKAGQDNELVLQHTSKSSIMVGTSMICKKLKYSLEYGSKIYITSYDGEYELELHYLSIRS